MTEPLTDAELDTLCEDSMGWPEIPVIVAELRALRQQNAELDAQLTAVRADSIEIARERNELREHHAVLLAALEIRDDIGWVTWLSPANLGMFKQEMDAWKATAEHDEALALD